MTRRIAKAARLRRRTFLAGAGAVAAAVPLRFAHAQGQKLKIGVLYPRSGIQAQIGIDCMRGVECAPEVLKARGYPEFEILPGDTETNPAVARSQCERLIEQGANIISGCFDSGQTLAAAQVCEAKGIPFAVSIAAAPALTEQGYKTIFRNFPTGPMIVTDSLNLQKDLFKVSGKTPKTMVLMHTNDTYGTNTKDALLRLFPKFEMPYKPLETIAYDPAARDLSAEVRKAKAANAELAMVISRVNDAILITQEMVKQRWVPMGIVSAGPGWYESVYMSTLGKYSDDVVSTVPWHDPNKPLSKALDAALKKRYPDRELNTNHTYSFEGILVAVDAFKRAGSTEPGKLIEALKKTDIKDNVVTGPGVHFDAKGQNPDVKMSAIQNRGGKNLVILPQSAAVTKPIWPMREWSKRG
ncbi:MAG TPA: ABC transporter substrate-binding protein [Alphaproteobacteria bacterium]|jgi:branched-chain amino acid transport system substrate-binding protein